MMLSTDLTTFCGIHRTNRPICKCDYLNIQFIILSRVLFKQLVHNSPQICGNTIYVIQWPTKGLLFIGFLAELPTILDSFSTVPQVVI